MEIPRADTLTPPPGTSLIETLRVDGDGAVPLLDGHLARLARSAAALGYACDTAAIRHAIGERARALPRGSAHRMRLLLDGAGHPSLETAVLPPLSALPGVALASERLDAAQLLLRHKTTHRPWYAQATAWLAAHGDCFDLLYANSRGELCEGSRSNVYLLRDGRWLTPPVESGLLPGVQRAALLAAGSAEIATLTLDDLAGAAGIRLSNALRGWFDVRRVDTA